MLAFYFSQKGFRLGLLQNLPGKSGQVGQGCPRSSSPAGPAGVFSAWSKDLQVWIAEYGEQVRKTV